MNDEETWELLESLMPSGIKMEIEGDSAIFSDAEHSVKVLKADDRNFQINGRSYHFDDTDYEVISTMLIPCILQELDGNRRM